MTEAERARATKFVEEWRGATSESSDSQTFWNEFFEIFGRRRRSVAIFEKSARRLLGRGRIDLFWPGRLIVEHKSAGESLRSAMSQALDYAIGLPEGEQPEFILVCDFANFCLADIERNMEHQFPLERLPDYVGLFGFMSDQPKEVADIDPVNQKATSVMGRVYESLAKAGYPPGDTERLLTRLAFCMFADDAGIFEHGLFGRWLDKTDGGSLGPMLNHLFQVLNTPKKSRQSTLDPVLDAFPHVDGDLFGGGLATAALTAEMRDLLLEADGYDWSRVNPAVFGGMFQVVMSAEARRRAGAHYTTEENIMRVIRPLFLDGLRVDFEEAKSGLNRRAALERFQDRLAGLKFLDPACGSGNFLAVAYRELRRLELEVILELHDTRTQRMSVDGLSKVDLHQFYGIEVKPFSARIAEISMWMTDHLMNRELGERYGLTYARIPHKSSPNIRCADALETDWNDLLPAIQCDYILGNPPYGGSKVMTAPQRQQVRRIADLGGSGGTLDYVAAWFFKAARYTKANRAARIGFVATNSIIQGEQVGQLWPNLLDVHELTIQFAYRPFRWGSEAPGKAHVHVVIIGLGRDKGLRRLFHIDGDDTLEENPRIITPYLYGAERARVVHESSERLNGLPEMRMGSKPIDGGHYIFTDAEKEAFLQTEPGAEPHMRPYVDARGFIHGKRRWILALHDAEPDVLRTLPRVAERVGLVKAYRLASKSTQTRDLAYTPTLYHLNVIPDGGPFLFIPSVSSEKRRYIPIGYMEPPTIPSNLGLVVEGANLGLFGLLTSRMHMAWLDTVCGRLETRYRYSAGMVYNTFPVPDSPLDALEPYAQAVLDVRAAHPNSTLADLYDPVTMPPDLVKAHRRLDAKVDRLYRREPFRSDDRITFLLERYAEIAAPPDGS